mmetsp:Transcript_166470/g.534818  ORF Transcript_166470/g.534818 Transcript_166470/m.534818 type:complete len:658 (-) Transcript_166470:9-1982(-)
MEERVARSWAVILRSSAMLCIAVGQDLSGAVGWRNDGRCGPRYLATDGGVGACPTRKQFLLEKNQVELWLDSAPCCGASGWCGSGAEHCSCETCVDYRKVLSKWPKLALPIDEPLGGLRTGQQALRDGGFEVGRWFSRIWGCFCMFLLCIVLPRRFISRTVAPWICEHPKVLILGVLALVVLQGFFFAPHSDGPSSASPPAPAAQQQSGSPPLQAASAEIAERSAGSGSDLGGGPSKLEKSIEEPSPESARKSDSPSIVASSDSTLSCSMGLRPVNPLDFGGRGDGKSDDSESVLAAMHYGARCGGTVVIGPQGHRFLVMPGIIRVELQHVTVIFEGILLGPSLSVWNPRHKSWPKGSCAYGESGCSASKGRSPEFARSKWSLLNLVNSSNVTLLGDGGGMEAPGRTFWSVRNSQPRVRGYCLLKLENCSSLQMRGLRLTDSPMYHIVIMESTGVRVERVSIVVNDDVVGDGGPHNTDGVSIISSTDVVLRDCQIDSGDDNVVIKEGSHAIYGVNLVLRRGKGISIGSLGERGSSQQFVTDIVFRNVTLQRSYYGARIKTWKGSTGLVRNVTFESFFVQDVLVGIMVDQNYCPLSQRPEGCRDGGVDAIRLEDVAFRGFSGTFVREERQISCLRCIDMRFERIALRKSLPARSGRER